MATIKVELPNVSNREQAEAMAKAIASIVNLCSPQELINVGKACEEKPLTGRQGLKFIS